MSFGILTISQKEICAVNDSLCSMRFIICCSVIGSYYETHTTERIVYCADLLLTYGEKDFKMFSKCFQKDFKSILLVCFELIFSNVK